MARPAGENRCDGEAGKEGDESNRWRGGEAEMSPKGGGFCGGEGEGGETKEGDEGEGEGGE